MLKRPVILSLATTLSLVMLDPPCKFGDKIDYKKYLNMIVRNAMGGMAKDQKEVNNSAPLILLMLNGRHQ